MFFCFLCRCRSLTVTELVQHLRKRHALYDGASLKLKCFNSNCSNTYTTFSGYRKHMRRCVSQNKENCENSNCNNATVNYVYNPVSKENSHLITFDTNKHLIPNNAELSLKDYSSSYVSKLYSLNLPDSTIQTIIEANEDFLKIFLKSNISH